MPIKQAIVAAVPKPYYLTVVGNYTSDMSSMLRAALTQKMLYVKRRMSPRPVILATPEQGNEVAALAARVARSIRMEVARMPELANSEFRTKGVELVIQVQVMARDDAPEEAVAQLEEQFEKQVEPWAENENTYVLALTLPAGARMPSKSDLDSTVLPVPATPPVGDYGDFDRIDEWKEEIIQEAPPPMYDRNNIPDYGPDIPPDGNKAGGLQQS